MIVLDASAAIELVLNLPLGPRVREELERAEWRIHAPDLITLEALQVLRRRVAAGITPLSRAEDARVLLSAIGIVGHEHPPLAERVWALRESLTAYDAAYVAVAEALDAPLVTADVRLARSSGRHVEVLLIS